MRQYGLLNLEAAFYSAALARCYLDFNLHPGIQKEPP
jgi:hypothetical protein